MEIGSAGAGSITQNVPTQTGSQQQVSRAEQQATLETSSEPVQDSAPPPPANERVGSLVDVTV